MDDSELHYLTYDPDAIMEDMIVAYYEAGGDILYPGDEKEMLLRAVQQIMVQAFAGIDNALRMDTLRYAVRDYLDVYGEKRNCIRIPARAATATVKITLAATGNGSTIPEGTALTADGTVIYTTTESLDIAGYAQELTVGVVCTQEGSVGNGLISGTQMQAIIPIDGAAAIVCTASASGGQDEETDDAYRERIRTYGLANVSTGPARQYEAAAKAVSSVILDAKAIKLSAGSVGVYLILSTDTGAAALIQAVTDALNAEDVRPLTDTVTVYQATDVDYTLNVQYSADSSSATSQAIADAVTDYQKWQDNTIGLAFNPDRLMAALYQAGATRVLWGTGSEFDGGTVEYTAIAENERCKGVITLTEITS